MRRDKITQGVNAAPQRSLLHALGLTDEEIGKPLIGIVSSQNEIVPGHMNLDKIVDAVKQGVALAGGVPIVFPAIAVCDGIAMGHEGMKYSLVTRELIADSTEAMATRPVDGRSTSEYPFYFCQRRPYAGWCDGQTESELFQCIRSCQPF